VIAVHPCTVAADFNAKPPPPPSPYTSSDGVHFTWHAESATFDDAEYACQLEGGHLAAYDNLIQQSETELYYINTAVRLGAAV
jgi:hypothetical protein